MHNWSTDEQKIKERGPEAYTIWKLEQMVNFGLGGGEKISKKLLNKYFLKLNIEPSRRKLFELLLK